MPKLKVITSSGQKKKWTLYSIKEVFSVTGVLQRDKYFSKPFLRLSGTLSVVWEVCVCHLNSALGVSASEHSGDVVICDGLKAVVPPSRGRGCGGWFQRVPTASSKGL